MDAHYMELILKDLKEANTMQEIKRKKVEPIGLSKPAVSADYRLIQPVDQPNYKPKRHRVAPMFFIKSKFMQWGISLLATIPEKHIWQFVDTVLDKLATKIQTYPKWVQVAYHLLGHIIAAVHPDSEGGYMITKAEMVELVNHIWEQIKEPAVE